MARELSLLDRVTIASPCHVPWSGMKGDDRVRFCESCKLHVYNLSSMDREEAERLVQQTEGRLCAAFYRRRDGTILTQDCPVGLQLVRRSLACGMAALGAVLMFVASTLATIVGLPKYSPRLRNAQPFAKICSLLSPPNSPAIRIRIMGSVGLAPGSVSLVPPANASPGFEIVGKVTAPRRLAPNKPAKLAGGRGG